MSLHYQIAHKDEEAPTYLYKVLSVEHWTESQGSKNLIVPPEDEAFIHFSKDTQLETIINKYWKDTSQFVVVKIAVDKLVGKLVYETNPGGASKYYHLYHGEIPMEAIIEAKVVER